MYRKLLEGDAGRMTSLFPKVCLDSINVMYVESRNGVGGSPSAFEKLESKFPTLKNRKFYGVLFGSPVDGVYRACVQRIKQENPTIVGLAEWTIPGGMYIKATINNWEEHTDDIGPTFSKMARQSTVDASRPVIEFYRSQKELILYLPV